MKISYYIIKLYVNLLYNMLGKVNLRVYKIAISFLERIRKKNNNNNNLTLENQ